MCKDEEVESADSQRRRLLPAGGITILGSMGNQSSEGFEQVTASIDGPDLDELGDLSRLRERHCPTGLLPLALRGSAIVCE